MGEVMNLYELGEAVQNRALDRMLAQSRHRYFSLSWVSESARRIFC